MNQFEPPLDRPFDRSRLKTERRIDYRAWLIKLIAWDGVMPVLVLLVPIIVDLLFPNRRGAMEFAAVSVPILAFIIRFFIAKRCIYSNQCTNLVRGFQLIALLVAILVLLLIDSLIILAQEMPQGAMVATKTDVIVWSILFSCYFCCMAFAMFPGKSEHLTIIPWCDVDSQQE